MKKVFEFVSTNVLSGLENVVVNICMLEKKYDCVYVSSSGVIDDYLKKYHIKHVVVNKITPFSVRKVIKQYHPDVVHGHDVKASLSVAFNYHLCHKHHIKVISELHSDDSRMWKYSLRSILYALSAPFYDDVIVVSKAIINHYIFKSLVKNKTHVISNIVNTNRINSKLLNNIVHKKYDCIFVGRLSDEKNPLKFVRIIQALKKKMPNISAIMLGNGNLYSQTQQLIDKLGLSKNIKMLGFQNNPYKYFKQSKICIVPSKFEGFGLVALESLLVGTPVIASPTGGLFDVVTSTCGGFAKDMPTYCKRISKLLGNKQLYETTSRNAFQRAKQVNNEQAFISKYSKIYSE